MYEEVRILDVKHPTYAALSRYTRALSVALGFRDLYTQLHAERVVSIAEAMGVRLGLSERELGILLISAALHDIGKIGVPDKILQKPGRLDAAETSVMQQHSETGAKIILSTELEGSAEVAMIIRHHHEHFDGLGYPAGLRGEAIPLASRIIGIADSYDAMAMTRAYHRARTHSDILDILGQETGRKHDPSLMDLFREIIEHSPYKAEANHSDRTALPVADSADGLEN